ncbi:MULTISPECIES: hypothetical protein [Alphaproteobacteria]|uniref:hypothetical protein n=1 Tax=Sphingopyxis sp. TaxID=1908224 RepID=UPI004034DC3A
MTITIAWVRRTRDTAELIVASDSRLRCFGAIDQAQKIFPLQRGDCMLAFCGDTDTAYPFFVQASSALNNSVRMRTRGGDIHQVAGLLREILDNLVASWSEPLAAKEHLLKDTRIMLAGWSAQKQRFVTGFFIFFEGRFHYLKVKTRLGKPYRERIPSLIVIGDHIDDFMRGLGRILTVAHPAKNPWKLHRVDLEYEPLEALAELLESKASDRSALIGGKPQMAKLYNHSNVLPIVIRTADQGHYLFGRKLFEWEKTEFPIAIVAPAATRFVYPMSHIPLPADVTVDPRVPSARNVFSGLARLLAGDRPK